MNAARRSTLKQIKEDLEEIQSRLEDVLSEEEECRDNTPYNFQESENYICSCSACDTLDSLIDPFLEIIEGISSVLQD